MSDTPAPRTYLHRATPPTSPIPVLVAEGRQARPVTSALIYIVADDSPATERALFHAVTALEDALAAAQHKPGQPVNRRRLEQALASVEAALRTDKEPNRKEK